MKGPAWDATTWAATASPTNTPSSAMANLESVKTYEGTHDIHTLIISEHITGSRHFRVVPLLKFGPKSSSRHYDGGYSMTGTKTDDLDAVRAVVDAIKDFKSDEQQRIIRWVAEKLSMPQPYAASVQAHGASAPASPVTPTLPASAVPASGTGAAPDIKSFVAEKSPRSDVQFAATVAYYYRFEAPQAERKDAINKDDLQEAARKAGRERFKDPLQTLHNAHTLGLLDKGEEKATFSINSVGENLVAMTLPGDGTAKNSKPPKKKAAKKTANKRAPSRTKKG